jgi:hypothetical protein
MKPAQPGSQQIRRQPAAEDDVARCPHCQKALRTRWKAGLTAVERAKRLHERQLKHFAETQRRRGNEMKRLKEGESATVSEHTHQIARHELDALVAEMVQRLVAPADNPLIAVEQLRGKVLRFPLQGAPHSQRITNERLTSIQSCCDELHLGLCRQPEAERWRAGLVAYERAEYQAQKAQP